MRPQMCRPHLLLWWGVIVLIIIGVNEGFQEGLLFHFSRNRFSGRCFLKDIAKGIRREEWLGIH